MASRAPRVPTGAGSDEFGLVRAFAERLPEALDDELAARLAERMRPFLSLEGMANLTPRERLLTVSEAAREAHVHVETIRRAIRDGRLPIAGRVGRAARIRHEALGEWLVEGSRSDETMPAATTNRRRRQRPRELSEYSLTAALKRVS